MSAKRRLFLLLALVPLLASCGGGGGSADVRDQLDYPMGAGSKCIHSLADNYFGSNSGAPYLIVGICQQGPASRTIRSAEREIKRRLP